MDIPAMDSEYFAAVESRNMKEAQRLVDEAAKAAGFVAEHLYHGTSGFGFTRIDVGNSDDGISFFATDNVDVAQGYFPLFENDYDGYHDSVREIGKKNERPRTPLSRNATADAVLAKIKADMPEYKTAVPEGHGNGQRACAKRYSGRSTHRYRQAVFFPECESSAPSLACIRRILFRRKFPVFRFRRTGLLPRAAQG